MIRVSLGTAACLGLTRMRSEALPTTAYLLHGEGCLMNCAFCPGRGSGGKGRRLGQPRPPFSAGRGHRRAAAGCREGRSGSCLQSVCEPGGGSALAGLIRLLAARQACHITFRLFLRCRGGLIFKAGADRISIALDTVSEGSPPVTGAAALRNVSPARKCARLWPGRMSYAYHLRSRQKPKRRRSCSNCWCGKRLRWAFLLSRRSRGPRWRGIRLPTGFIPPPPGALLPAAARSYFMARLRFRKGRLVSFGIGERAAAPARRGEAFQTGGCPGCNRPILMKGRAAIWLPRPLSAAETAAALAFI